MACSSATEEIEDNFNVKSHYEQHTPQSSSFPFTTGEWKIMDWAADRAYGLVFLDGGKLPLSEKRENESWSLNGNTLIYTTTSKSSGRTSKEVFVYEKRFVDDNGVLYPEILEGTMTVTITNPDGSIAQQYTTVAYLEKISD